MAKDMKSCPFCGVEVRKSNFNKHVRKAHQDLDDKELKKEGLAVQTKNGRKKQREEKKREEARKREKRREMRLVAVGIILVVIISVVGVIVYEYATKGSESGDGTIPDGGGSGNPVAVMVTSMGTIKIELYEDDAPETAGNFIGLSENGFYDGLIFHRVDPGFVIQGGGYLSDGTPKSSALLPWEGTGYRNKRYTIAMARSGDPDSREDSGSATCQFFINLADNTKLDDYAYPYVVFGKVVEGFSVVDAIGNLATGTRNGMSDWPDNPPVINSVTIVR